MLIRISLILAIIAGLAVGVVNFISIKQKITDLRTHLKEQTDRAETAEHSLAQTKKKLDATTAELTQTKKDLDDSKNALAAATTKVDDLTKLSDKLKSDLADTQKKLSDDEIDLNIYHGPFPTPQDAVTAGKRMKEMEDRVAVVEDEKKVLQRQLVRVQSELDVYKNPDKPVPLPVTLVGKVLVTDPKWDFVVLNVGAEQGALERGEMLVNRDGRLVAKVKITSVQKDRCIANVMPGWKLGQVLEGDQVIPAHPSES